MLMYINIKCSIYMYVRATEVKAQTASEDLCCFMNISKKEKNFNQQQTFHGIQTCSTWISNSNNMSSWVSQWSIFEEALVSDLNHFSKVHETHKISAVP